MNKLNKVFFMTTCMVVGFIPASAQNKSATPVLTADSLASGNYKNILTSFFQAATNDLTGPSKGFEFKSNIFAIMLKNNPNLIIDTNYLKYSACRNINLDLGIKDSNNQFSSVNVGLTYAIVNRRDASVKSFVKKVMEDSTVKKLFRLDKIILSQMQTNNYSQDKISSILTEYGKFVNDTSNFIKFSSLSTDLQGLIKNAYGKVYGTKLNISPNYSIHKVSQAVYDSIKKSYQNRGLWTIGTNFNKFTDPHQLSGVSFSSQYVKGFINPNAATNLEVTISAAYSFSDDSTVDANLKRQTFTGEAGLNWVIKGWGSQQQPSFELKMTTADNGVTTVPYKGEQKNIFTLNGTLSIRISNSIIIPIQIKYDPKSGNVFGFLNITSNFTSLGSIFK